MKHRVRFGKIYGFNWTAAFTEINQNSNDIARQFADTYPQC